MMLPSISFQSLHVDGLKNERIKWNDEQKIVHSEDVECKPSSTTHSLWFCLHCVRVCVCVCDHLVSELTVSLLEASTSIMPRRRFWQSGGMKCGMWNTPSFTFSSRFLRLSSSNGRAPCGERGDDGGQTQDECCGKLKTNKKKHGVST